MRRRRKRRKNRMRRRGKRRKSRMRRKRKNKKRRMIEWRSVRGGRREEGGERDGKKCCGLQSQ